MRLTLNLEHGTLNRPALARRRAVLEDLDRGRLLALEEFEKRAASEGVTGAYA